MHKMLITFIISILLFSISGNTLNNEIENKNDIPFIKTISEEDNHVNQKNLNNHFTANYGQVNNNDIRFYIEGQGVWFTPTGVVFEMPDIIKFEFLGCNKVIPAGIGELSFRSNFFYGNDSSKWCTDVPNYNEIYYENVYNNIDLKYYFNEHGLKYDFIINPGGDPDNIMIKVTDAEEINLNSKSGGQGDSLNIKTNSGYIVDNYIFVYQTNVNEIIEINAKYKLIDIDCYGFSITKNYDRDKTLIIDPLLYSTFIGGKNNDTINDIILDNQGNVYLTGWTNSSNFPVKADFINNSHIGEIDIFITKMNREGDALIFSTYVGGSNNDFAFSAVLDMNGNLYITGYSESADFPTTSGAYDESYNGGGGNIIVMKISTLGNDLNFSTYIGQHSLASDIALDGQGNIFITGFSKEGYPTTPGVYKTSPLNVNYYHVIISKLNNTGTDLICSTIIGTMYSGESYGINIELDKKDNICVSGMTYAPSFPVTSGAYKESFTPSSSVEGFVFTLNNNMSSLLYSTFVGYIYPTNFMYSMTYPNIFIDNENNIIITGSTRFDAYQTTENAYDSSYNGLVDNYILKLNSNLSKLLYSTYLGGSGNDYVFGSYLDNEENLILIGSTNSSDFPIREGVYDPYYNGKMDIFVAKLNFSDSMLRYSTYFGSVNNDYGYCMALDKNGKIYIAGQAENGFPTTPGSYDPTFNGGSYDGIVLKLEQLSNAFVFDLRSSKSEIFRTHTIELFSNASDNEDPEKDLTPHFFYVSPDQPGSWSDLLLSEPVYLNDRWQVTFSIPRSASLGYYTFRVRYNDTDDMWSRWFYLNDSLLVKNNQPGIDYFNVSKSAVVIDEEFSILVNGTDIEDGLEDLTFQPQYKFSDDIAWTNVNVTRGQLKETKWEYTMSIGPDMDYSYYDFRVCVNDSDNDFSDWSYLPKSLLVLPAPPELISLTLSEPVIYRTDVVWAYINCTDPDSTPDELFVELQYMPVVENKWHDISANYYEPRWESYIKSQKSWRLGNYSFRARVSDWEENVSPWFYLNNSLMVLNNLPEITAIEDIPGKMDRKSKSVISVIVKDVEDPVGSLNAVLEYKLPGGTKWIDDHLSEPSYVNNIWQYEMELPDDAPSGTYRFRARVQDLDGDWSPYLYMNDSMVVQNAVPEVILFEQSPAEVLRTEDITITASGADLETPPELLVCEIYYLEPGSTVWNPLMVDYNTTSSSWDSGLITSKTSKTGNYSFKVQFSDIDGAISKVVYANESVWVKNNMPVISAELDDITIGKTQHILKLTDYGYDVETSKGQLIWLIDQTTVDTSLYHIETDNLDGQEITIYPVKNKKDNDELTVILFDADGGRAVRADVTVVVDSRSSGGTTPGDDENPVSDLTKGSSIWIILLIVIIVIVLIAIFLIYRRKKRQEKEEEARKKEEEARIEEESKKDKASTVAEGETSATSEPSTVTEPPLTPVPVPVSVPAPEPAPGLEAATVRVPSPVPMPAPIETPELPPAQEEMIDEMEEQPTAQMVPCPTCGAEIPAYASPCPKCDTVLNWS